jgi:hypothetical protein
MVWHFLNLFHLAYLPLRSTTLILRVQVVWVYFYLPEIKNRTLEEIDEMFEARLPARKFRNYVCTGSFIGVPDTDEKRRDSEKDEVERHEVVGVKKTG